MGVFEFRIIFCKIFFPVFDFSENERFVFLLVSLPGANFVKNTVCHFVDVPARGEFCEKSYFCYFEKFLSVEQRRYLHGVEPQ